MKRRKRREGAGAAEPSPYDALAEGVVSGICSQHQGHDPACPRCLAIPLTDEKRAYYRGWDESLAAMRRNCWTPVENCVLNVYTRLEDAARAGDQAALGEVLREIDQLRDLGRGMWGRGLDT
jgi:hypothetical protein